MTNVVMFTNAVAPDKLGGLERYVRELSAQLVVAGIDVTVVTKQVDASHALEELGDDGVRIVRHAVPSKKNPLFAAAYPLSVGRAVRRQLRVSQSAILHGHYAFTSLPLAFGEHPYVYTFHAPVHKEVLAERQNSYTLPRAVQAPAVAAVRRIEKRVVSQAQQTVVLSDFMRAELSSLSPVAGQRTRMIPGGIDTEWFDEGSSARDPWASQARPLLFTARRFTERTGVAELVTAMSTVIGRFPQARLAVAGDGRLRPDIERSIEALGLQSSVRLLGRVSDEDLRTWYRTADLCVMPTQELEGFGLTTGESMACGTPVLVTPVGANPELVSALHPLLVASGASAESIAQAVMSLLGAGDLLSELGQQARSYAVSRWSWKTVVQQYLDVYDAVGHSGAIAR